MSKILSFDTSNYTTSACLFDTQNGVVWENRIMLPVTSGKCGLRQNEAVFLHNRNLLTLFENMPEENIDYIAASICPSERTDSYMPCFLVGNSFATSLSKILHVPLYKCSHQKNHIGAAVYSGECTNLLKDEFFAYHISGGTTDILLCSPTDGVVNIHKVGGTADISCGQLIDRIGVELGMPFPCGAHLEKLSSGNLTGKIKINKKEFYYNFSGFENKANQLISSGTSINDVSDYVLDVVYSFISDSISDIRYLYKDLPVVLTGGVMSNKILSNLIRKNIKDVYFAQTKYSTDNALGTAYMCSFERGLLDE